jgi:hypothetical protein
MGLKYYDDFEQRIPRDEVTEAVSIIRDTVLDVLQVRRPGSADTVEWHKRTVARALQ